MGAFRGPKGFRAQTTPQMVCARCDQSKPIEDFRVLRHGSRASYCRPCQLAETREWRSRNREAINAGRRAAPQTKTCAECSGRFATSRSKQIYCSALCGNRVRQRRAYNAGSRRSFPKIHAHTRRQVLERDGWRCGLCGGAIDRDLRYPHPGSPSVDHIDPNGAHEAANWQASHLACNVQAGAKGSARPEIFVPEAAGQIIGQRGAG